MRITKEHLIGAIPGLITGWLLCHYLVVPHLPKWEPRVYAVPNASQQMFTILLTFDPFAFWTAVVVASVITWISVWVEQELHAWYGYVAMWVFITCLFYGFVTLTDALPNAQPTTQRPALTSSTGDHRAGATHAHPG